MKKTLIAAGIAAAVAAPVAMADTTVYGKIRTAINSGDTTTAIQDFSHRFGFKGSEDLGNGLTALYTMELATGNDHGGTTTQRQTYVGLKGGFGTVLLGDASSPQKMTMNVGKKFEDTIADRSYILAEEGGFKNDVVAYVSPTVNGFHGAVALVADNTTTDDVAAKSYALVYDNGPLYVGLGATTYDAVASGDSRSLSVAYTMGDLKVSGIIEKVEDDASTRVIDEDNKYVDVAYKLGGGNTLIAAWGENDVLGTADKEVTSIAVEHAFSKRTQIMAIYDMEETKGSADNDNFSIQLNHSF
jgi:predicted porin